MAIKDILTGGKEVEAARTTIRDIEGAKHSPSYGQTQELQEARRVLFNWRARVGAELIAVLAVFALAVNSSKENHPIETSKAPTVLAEKPAIPNIETQTDSVIAKVEAGFEKLEQTLRPRIEAMEDRSLRMELMGPFEMVKVNEAFSGKNGPRFHREQSRGGAKETKLENPYFFGYRAQKLETGAVAGFEAPTKTMFLNPNIDLNNLLDFLIIYHELRHAAQDGNIRKAIRSQEQFNAYLRFHTQDRNTEKRVEIMHEATAYAYEIEMLDLILEGELKKTITMGEPLDINNLLKKLNARVEQKETVELLVGFARAYYPEAQSKGGLTKRFVDFTARLYREKGYAIYMQTERGYERFND